MGGLHSLKQLFGALRIFTYNSGCLTLGSIDNLEAGLCVHILMIDQIELVDWGLK